MSEIAIIIFRSDGLHFIFPFPIPKISSSSCCKLKFGDYVSIHEVAATWAVKKCNTFDMFSFVKFDYRWIPIPSMIPPKSITSHVILSIIESYTVENITRSDFNFSYRSIIALFFITPPFPSCHSKRSPYVHCMFQNSMIPVNTTKHFVINIHLSLSMWKKFFIYLPCVYSTCLSSTLTVTVLKPKFVCV